MTTITLASIQAEQSRVNSMIDAFVKQQRVSEYCIPEAYIELHPGERYAGIVLDDDGEPSHHLVQLPGDEEDLTHDDALAWAKGVGGDLPSRREQALLFANLRGFQKAAYWSAETHAEDSSYAWCQYFSGGNQFNGLKSAQLRAVAVRRLVIE
ncbi:DUF1566 domain-containing protein [Castellaniella sp.]|uniref:DUF1566 domain-containing protein n=1 Tax=Castellaniella sp. TaxID=1955812 RepID=UPI003A8E20D2